MKITLIHCNLLESRGEMLRKGQIKKNLIFEYTKNAFLI